MLAFAFLNPLLLWAVPLCAVPIVIHLLNRRRFHKVPWAAMEFLLAAMKRNRKRLRMEQWLVLLLRTLAVLLLVFLVSRPQLGGGTFLSARTHHVVVLDDSASMTQRAGSAALFERAQDRVRALADDLGEQRGGDLLSIVRTSRAGQPDLWAQRVGPELGRRTGALLKELAVGDQACDLGAVLVATQKRAAEVKEAGRTHYYVVGDLRAHDWATPDDKPRPLLLQALSALRADTDQVSVIATAGPPANLAVVDVRLLGRLAVVGVSTALAVDVQNFGLDPAPAGSLAVEVDGQSRVVLPVPPLSPGEKVAIPIAHTFHQAGAHRIDAQIEASEAFPLDDRRTLALDVADKSRVLLIDGQPDEELGETFFLQAAFEPPESGVEVTVATDTATDELDLATFDVVWLCNVQSPTASLCQRLEAFVASGGGLVVTAGALVDATRYDELLWRSGQGLLPMPFGEIAGDPDKPEVATLVKPDHPVCGSVAEIVELLLANVVMVKRWLALGDDPTGRTQVVARIRDAEGPPLLVTRTYAPPAPASAAAGSAPPAVAQPGGEVAQFAITADTFWCNLPSTDLFLVLANQLHRTSARRRDTSGNNLLPDGSLHLVLDAGTYRPDATVRALGGDDERTFTASEAPIVPPQSSQQPASQQPANQPTPNQPNAPTPPTDAQPKPPAPPSLTVPMHELRRLGAYELELARHDGAVEKRLFARNAPTAESDLRPFGEPAFARLYPSELHRRVTFVRDQTGLGEGTGEGEMWHLLAALLLAGLVAESLLAWRFGRR